MSEFKGTKAKWTMSNSIGFIADEKDNFAIVKVFCNTHISEEEQNFNLKLIAHAPELLEALSELLKELEFHGFHNSTAISQAKELIKSATE